jgi:hypothetical protein
MRRSDSGPIIWYPAQLRPGIVTSFRRWNIVIISILLFLVIGLTIAAIISGIERAASASKHPSRMDHHKASISLVVLSNTTNGLPA